MIEHDAIAPGYRSGQSMPIDYDERERDFPAILADTRLSRKTKRVSFGQPTVQAAFRQSGFSRVRNILLPGTAAIILLDVYDTRENVRCSGR